MEPILETERLILRRPIEADLPAWAEFQADAEVTRLGSTNLGPGRLPPPYESERIDLWGQTAVDWKTRRG